MIELTVTVKGEDSTYRQKFLVYDAVEMRHDHPVIQACLQQALQTARIEPEYIKIRALMVVK